MNRCKIVQYARVFVLMLLVAMLQQSCVKTLTDDDEFILCNGGKELHIHIPKGVSLSDATASIDMYKVENLTISGHLGGHNLAFIRDLAGGDNIDFLAERNLGVLNLKECSFLSGEEVYYCRDGIDLKIKAISGIPAYAFENCYVLNTITLPDTFGGYNIDKGAFMGCTLLRNVNWGRHIRKIKEDAFRGCSTLAFCEPLVLPEGLEQISNRAFKETIPHSVDLPSTIEYIGEEAFSPILNNVIIRAENPPQITESSFIFHKNSDKILYVPKTSVEIYKVEPYLLIFNEIKALEREII